MTSPLVDPREAAFFATDPSRRITEQPPPVQVPDYRASSRRLTELGVALGAAFIVYRKYVSAKLKAEAPPPMNTDRYRHIKSVLRHSPFWVQLSVPIIREAVELGNVAQLSSEELEVIAQSYAEDLGEYIDNTSGEALVQGFEDQLQKRWSDTIAWHRTASAFGLDRQQMRAFMQNVMDVGDSTDFDLLPDKAQAFLDKALTDRADRIGGHEVWQAKSAGKAIAWLTQQNNGILPPDAQKQWITAEDEMVCPQCGPLHKVRIALDERWETPDGNRYWAPGVHPNCRCDIRLLYPEIVNDPNQMVLVRKDAPNDPHDRDRRGRFARVESRQAPVAERDPVLENFLEELRATTQEADKVREKIADPNAGKTQLADPNRFQRAKVADPNARKKVADPNAQQATPQPAFADPNKQQVANPNAPKRRKKIREKQTLVILPGGKIETRPNSGVDHIQDGEVARTYVFAHEHYGNMNIDPATADAQPHYRDQVIDFNYGDPLFRGTIPSARGYAYSEVPSQIMEEADGLYPERGAWDTPTGQSFAREYDETWNKWYGTLVANKQSYIYGLSEADTQRIWQNAGNAAVLDHDGRVNSLLRADEESPTFHAFVNYMERSKLDVMSDHGDSAAGELQGLNQEMQQAGYIMHTPTVFILNDLDPDTGIIDPDAGEVAVAGRYRVNDTFYLSSVLEMGSSRPPDIRGVNFVYLDSIIDEDEDSVVNYEEDFDFTSDDYLDEFNGSVRDQPRDFPGIGYYGEHREDSE